MTPSQLPNWMSGRARVRWLAAGPGGVDGLEQVGIFGAGEEAQVGGAAGVAHGETEHVGWLFLAVGVAGIARKLDGAVQRDYGRTRGRIGRKAAAK